MLANRWSLPELKIKLITTHKINMERKPEKNARSGCWGIKADTINPTIAILHHGRKRHAAKLNKAINKRESKVEIPLVFTDQAPFRKPITGS